MAYAAAVTRRRAIVKLIAGLFGVGSGVALGAWYTADRVGDRVYRAQLVNEARSIADMAENVGAWAATYRGVWIKDDGLMESGVEVGARIDTRYRTEDETAGTTPELLDTYHRKNPALVQRELADVIQKSDSRGKFRLTSDKYMNPMIAPDGFHRRAIQNLRASREAEYLEVSGGELRYARRVEAKASCMSCHDTPEKAPKTIALLYPGHKATGTPWASWPASSACACRTTIPPRWHSAVSETAAGRTCGAPSGAPHASAGPMPAAVKEARGLAVM
ncbi:MAG: DUF3365 domain-containing protein [Pseudomonadota bacterium]